MPDAPKITADRLKTITDAWEKLAKTATFGGMTLAQFKAAIQPSLEARATIADLETQMTDALNVRTTADLVVDGVIGNEAFGRDSSLYEEMGYVRKSERKSGLTRKKTPPTK